MEPATSEWTAVMNRLERLETQNRRFKQIGALALILAGSVLLMGQAPATRTVEANEFVLRDTSGKVRALLGATGNGATFHLSDANGQMRVRLTISEDAAGLVLYDKNGKPRVELGGSSAMDLFTLKDSDGRVRAALGAGDEVFLRLTEANGALRVMLDVREDGPQLGLLDASGREAAILKVNPEETSLKLADKEGFQTTVGSTTLVTPRTGETHKTSAASVVLFDKDKNVLWKAP